MKVSWPGCEPLEPQQKHVSTSSVSQRVGVPQYSLNDSRSLFSLLYNGDSILPEGLLWSTLHNVVKVFDMEAMLSYCQVYWVGLFRISN